jgi:catechol 2,3-dioxygenase-like lactoylglutathione lyase family enzyme
MMDRGGPCVAALVAGVLALVAVAGGALVASAPAVGEPTKADAAQAHSAVGDPIPGVLGVDHFGIAVPDVEEARDWFVDVVGCVAPLTFGPFSDPGGSLMRRLVGVHPRAVLEQIVMVRCGTGSSIELFQWDAPRQDQTFAKNSDWSGHHVALYVTDIDEAVAYLAEQPGAEKLLGPLPVTEGPAAGQTINYFKTDFGLYVELISYPDGMAYEDTAETKLWNPADVGATPSDDGVPGLLGVDHFGMAVPDIARARDWLERTLGCVTPLRFGPFSDPDGDFMTQLLDVHPRAVIHEINMLRCGENGANIEIFEWSSPDQDRSFPLNSDLAGNHFAVYVEDIDAAAAAMRGRGVRPFLGPFPVTDGPAAGQTINYFFPPLVGHYLELISYPEGMAYEATAETPLWSPRDP